ncbi:hypothetical protein ABPG75_005364 [Micractinium tetrahymenae]
MTVELQADDSASGRAAPIEDRKLRILCLHGYLQNAEVFRSRIGSLRKALKSRAEFVFLDAPYLAEPGSDAAVAESGGERGSPGRSWWQWSDLDPGTRPSRAAQYRGWEASRAAIQAALVQHAPVDGLLGFSQGATAAALFLAGASLPEEPARGEQQQSQQTEQQPQQAQQTEQHAQQQHQQEQPAVYDAAAVAAALAHLRFAVIIAGFMPRDASYAAALQSGAPSLPSLHVVGQKDALVPEERSAALWGCFAAGGVHIYRHPGAHMVPTCSGEFKQELQSLLDDAKAGRLAHKQQQARRQCVDGTLAAAADEAAEAVAALAVG